MASGKGRLWVTAIIAVAVVLIAAVIVLYPHETTVLTEGDGKVTPSGNTEMRFTETLHLEIVPGEDTVAYVYMDGVLKAQDVTSYDFRVSALDFDKHTIEVVFQKETPPEPEKEFTLSVTSEGEGTITPSGETRYAEGTVVTVKATPGSGNVIGDIIIDGVSAGPGGSLQVRMDSDHDVKVVFRPIAEGDIPVTISVDVDLDIVVETLGATLDYGEVIPSGTVYVAPHGSLTITVVLNPGFEMNDMTVDGISYGAVTEHTITDITKSVDVRISIVKKVEGFIIKASAGTGGSISPSGDVKVEKGKDMTFSFTPASGYKVSTLTIDEKTVTVTSNSYTFTDVQSAHTIAVTFQSTGGSGGGGGSTKVLTGIRIATPPTKTSYNVGESFDPNGMRVNAVYSDGTESEIASFTYSPTGNLTLDVDHITVAYQGRTATVEITVTEKILTGIEMTTYPSKVSYEAGESFSPEGMVITAFYSNGDSEPVTGYAFSPAVFLDEGRCTVTVSYREGEVTKTCEVPVTVGYSDKVSVKVKEYSGTMMSGGSVISFTETPNQDLESFKEYHLQNIVPGIRQTITLEVINESGYSLDLSLYIKTVDSTEKLSKQIQFSGTSIEPKTLHDMLGGSDFSVGSVDSGRKITVMFDIEFLNLPNNNEVMGHSLSFTLGIKSMANIST